MPKIPRRIPFEFIDFAANAPRNRELPKTVYKGILCELAITHTNGAAPVITADSMLAVMNKLNLVINGQDHLQSVPLRHWFYQNNYDFSRPANGSHVSLFTTPNVQGTSRLWFYMPMALTRALQPEDTILDARNFKNLTLEAYWGSSIGAQATINSGSLSFIADEYGNVDEQFQGARHEFTTSSRNLDKTGAVQIDLETRSNNQYRRLWIYTRDNTGALSDAQIDNLIVRSRSFHYDNISALKLQRYNAFEYSRDHQTGLYVLDFTRDGKMTQRIDARDLSELILEVNSLVPNGTIEVVKEKVIFG